MGTQAPTVPLQDKWQPLLSTVTGVHRYKWLKQSMQGLPPQSALLGTIAEFALREEPVDVEKMRKCLLKQVASCRERPPQLCPGPATLAGHGVLPGPVFCSWREQRSAWRGSTLS